VNFYAASLGELQSSTVADAMRRAEAERPGLEAQFERDRDAAYPILLGMARRHVLENPLRYAETGLERTWLLYGAWWPALLAAGYGLWRRRSSRAALAAGAVGASLGAYGLVAVQPNYADAARPLLAVLLGWGLTSIAEAAGERAEKPGAAPTAAAWGAAAFAAILAAALLLADGLVLREPLLVRLRSGEAAARTPRPRDGRAEALELLLLRRDASPAGQFAWGRMLTDAGSAGEACRAFQAAWRRDRGLFEAGLKTVSCLAGERRMRSAEDVARQLVELGPRDGAAQARARAALARVLAASGRAAQAGAEWSRVAALHPPEAALRLEAGEGLLAAGRASAALAQARESRREAKEEDERIQSLMLEAKALKALGRADEGRGVMAAAEGTSVLVAAIVKACAAKRFGDALSIADALVLKSARGSPFESARARVLRGRVLLFSGRPESADDEFARAAAVAPVVAASWADYLGWLKSLRARGRDAEARAFLDRALAGPLGSDAPVARASALAARGAIRGDLGDAAGASEDLAAAVAAQAETACRARPDLVDAGRLPARYFADCLKAFPRDAGLLSDQGVALWRDGKRAEAVSSLRAALDADPARLSAALSLAAALAPDADGEGRRRLRMALDLSAEPKGSPLRATARTVLAGGKDGP